MLPGLLHTEAYMEGVFRSRVPVYGDRHPRSRVGAVPGKKRMPAHGPEPASVRRARLSESATRRRPSCRSGSAAVGKDPARGGLRRVVGPCRRAGQPGRAFRVHAVTVCEEPPPSVTGRC
ncbi:hypothetical protein GCM10010216_46600 [Streptomyces flaveolus]|nr:hypothetical protein GCM10010216_46600 [Streptomyces flaveolus]